MGLLANKLKRYKKRCEELENQSDLVGSKIFAVRKEFEFEHLVRRDAEKRVDFLLATLFFLLDHLLMPENIRHYILNRIKIARLHSSAFEALEESECPTLPKDLEK